VISEVDRGTAWEDGQMDGIFVFLFLKMNGKMIHLAATQQIEQMLYLLCR